MATNPLFNAQTSLTPANSVGAPSGSASAGLSGATRLAWYENQAFQSYPKACNLAVSYLIQQLVDPNFKTRTANEIADYMMSGAGKWRQISKYQDMQALANAGVLVIGVLREPGDGHVLAVAPGQMKYSGNYVMPNGKLDPIQTSSGKFPLSLSTSKGSWPGAMSNGDRTVRDAFSAAQFPNVTFWAPQ